MGDSEAIEELFLEDRSWRLRNAKNRGDSHEEREERAGQRGCNPKSERRSVVLRGRGAFLLVPLGVFLICLHVYDEQHE